MPVRNKVSALPPKVKAWLDAALVENNYSGYEALSAELKARGYSIGKSALHRYGQEFENKLSALRTASEQAKAVVEAAPDEEGAVNEALMRLVQEHLFQLMMSDDGKSIDIAKIARATAELGKATIAQKRWMAEVRSKAEAAAKAVENIAKKGGLTAQTVDDIRRQILGIAS